MYSCMLKTINPVKTILCTAGIKLHNSTWEHAYARLCVILLSYMLSTAYVIILCVLKQHSCAILPSHYGNIIVFIYPSRNEQSHKCFSHLCHSVMWLIDILSRPAWLVRMWITCLLPEQKVSPEKVTKYILCLCSYVPWGNLLSFTLFIVFWAIDCWNNINRSYRHATKLSHQTVKSCTVHCRQTLCGTFLIIVLHRLSYSVLNKQNIPIWISYKNFW